MLQAVLAHVSHALLEGLRDSAPTLLCGPSGSGKSYVLRSLVSVLEERGIPHLYIDAATPEAPALLEQAGPETALLFDSADLASFDTLRAAARHTLAGAPTIAAITEGRLDSGYGARLTLLSEQMPEAEAVFAGARTLRIEPSSHAQIARLLHRASHDYLDAATVDAIQQLAWGRPGWALDLLRLHRTGSLTATPCPRILQLSTGDAYLSAFRHPMRAAETLLSAEETAAAITLAAIGPRTLTGVIDTVGAETQAKLQDHHILLAAPHSPDLLGVPELYAAAMHSFADPALLAEMQERTATHLLAQESFGIPLAAREASFCAKVLSRGTPRGDSDAAEHRTRFQLRVIADLIGFGKGTDARDMLLRLDRSGPSLSPLLRARLTTVLRDAHTGLQSLLLPQHPHGNSELPSPDPELGFAMLLLRGRLSAEEGIPFEPDPDIAPDDRDRLDAQLVARRWNDGRPLGPDIADLARIAHSHPLPEVALLAEQLLALDAAFFGLRFRHLVESPVEQRISQLSLRAGEAQRDALECAIVVHGISQLFSCDADRQMFALVERAPGAARHRAWALHLHAVRTAIICGDAERARFEWGRFAAALPRFLPWRLRLLVAQVGDIAFDDLAGDTDLAGLSDLDGDAEAGGLTGRIGLVFAYFAGRLDLVEATASFGPAAYLRHNGLDADWPGGAPAELRRLLSLEEAPEREPARMHIRAAHEQDPLALMRAADALEAQGLWGPAANALQEARRIFLRRRASGSVAAADARLEALQSRTAQRVAWFDVDALEAATREHLTPRETATARLAAEGLSNREIAERMRCSVRTVESHLAQARAKLGVASRAELKTHLHDLLQPLECGTRRSSPVGAGR